MDYYSSRGAKAWRVVIISAINYALENNFFKLEHDGNDNRGALRIPPFEFFIVGVYPCKVIVSDIGFGELCFDCKVLVRERLVHCVGWLERKTDRYLQRSPAPTPLIRPAWGKEVYELAGFNRFVDPQGYRDTGPMFL